MSSRRRNKGKGAKRRPTQARSRATVEVILTGAAQVLERHGYGHASTDRIAERAGVSVGSIYQYFRNKNEIFETLFDRESSRLLSTLDSIVGGPPTDSHQKLRAFLHAGASPQFLPPRLYDELVRVPGLEIKVQAYLDKLIETTVRLIESSQPGLPDAEVRALARLVVATAEGIGRPLRTGSDPDLLDRYVEMIDSFVLGPTRAQFAR